MKELRILLIITFLLFGTVMSSADWAYLIPYFTNNADGSDPGEPDTLFIQCINQA